ncbi:caspase family protein [Runella zeae]|uniref:caspase family protein n=1 Tax=Runella zeae TaxID=94255 RepID=UPI000407CB39|nr:caspase family protein [Runella zeae]
MLVLRCTFLWALFFHIVTVSAQPTKHALIIAIGNYDPATTGWPKLASLNDVPLIQTVLQQQGFMSQHITVVQDVDATGILTAFQKLIESVQNGDIAVLHYSGHGVQLQDDNGDEPDQLDEALVPLGAAYKPEELNTNHYIRDDVLGKQIALLRHKLGPKGHLLLFLDSCHSGAGTRGNGTARGGFPPLVKSNYSPTIPPANPSQSLVDNPVASRGAGDEELAKFVVFAGASSNENNFETTANGKPVGSLSFSISNTLSQLRPNDTYRQVFARIRAEMAVIAPRQSPILEGDADYLFFSGQLVKQEPYVEIKKVLNNSTLQLSAGLVAGISKGDVFALYPAGTASIKEERPVFEGEVTAIDYFTASLSLKNPISADFKAPQYWAFRTQQSFSESLLKVAFDFKGLSSESTKVLSDSLSRWNFLSVVASSEAPDILLKNTANTSNVGAFVGEMPYLSSKPVNLEVKEGLDLLKKTLLSAAQVKFMKAVKLATDEIVVEMSLVRAKIDQNNAVVEIFDTPVDTLTRRFSEKDNVVIKLVNKGKRSAYYNIVAIQPDHRIVPVAPGLEDHNDPNSYKIAAGETVFLKNRPIYGFWPPYGTEMMKVFATPQPINLLPAIETQGTLTSSTRGQENPLVFIMKNYHTRGVSNNIGSTFEYIYTITPFNSSITK